MPVHVSKSLNSANHTFSNMRFRDPSSPSSAHSLLIHQHTMLWGHNAWHTMCLLVCSHFPDFLFMLETSPLAHPTLQFPAPLTAQPNTESKGSHSWVHNRAEAGGNKGLVVRDKERSCSTRELCGPLYCYFLAFLIHVMHDTSIFSTFVLSGIELCCQSRLFCS